MGSPGALLKVASLEAASTGAGPFKRASAGAAALRAALLNSRELLRAALPALLSVLAPLYMAAHGFIELFGCKVGGRRWAAQLVRGRRRMGPGWEETSNGHAISRRRVGTSAHKAMRRLVYAKEPSL